MVATLDGLLARHPRRLGRRAGVRRFRDELLAEHERAAEELLGEGPMREEVLLELAASRPGGFDDWDVRQRLAEAYIEVKLGDKVIGGETVLAQFE